MPAKQHRAEIKNHGLGFNGDDIHQNGIIFGSITSLIWEESAVRDFILHKGNAIRMMEFFWASPSGNVPENIKCLRYVNMFAC